MTLYFEIFISLLSVGIAGLHAYKTYKDTGHIDLSKTLEAAKDAMPSVLQILEDSGDRDAAVSAGISEIERIRGHQISPKLKRKAAARIGALLSRELGA